MAYDNDGNTVTLLSPLGLLPGLLYSALMTVKPQNLVVLTSAEGENSLDGIVRQADYHGFVNVVQVEDAFSCFNQANEKVKELLEFIDDNSCAVNLTGGTTALQFIIQRVGTALEARGSKVEYIALVDRRDIQEQRNNPWVVGEMVRVI